MTVTSGEGAKSIKAMREALGSAARAGDFETIFQMLDAQGDCLPLRLQVYFGALALVRTGRPAEALEVLKKGPRNRLFLLLRFDALIDAGEIRMANQLLPTLGLASQKHRVCLGRLTNAAFAAGNYRAAANWGFKLRQASPRPMPRFNADLSSLILLGDVEAVRERLPLCGSNQAAILGHALREAAVVLDRRAVEGKKVQYALLRPFLDLMPDPQSLKIMQNAARQGTPVSRRLLSMIRRMPAKQARKPGRVKAVREQLEKATKAQDYEAVFAILDKEGAQIPVPIQTYFRAHALLRIGRPDEALQLLEKAPETGRLQRLRLGALIGVGRLAEAGQLFSVLRDSLKPQHLPDFFRRLSLAAFVAGDYHAAAQWGLELRNSSLQPIRYFRTDLSALILLNDVGAVRERLKLCKPVPVRILGVALREAALVLDHRAEQGEAVDYSFLEVYFALASNFSELWEIKQSIVTGLPQSPKLSAMIWDRLCSQLSPDEIDPNAFQSGEGPSRPIGPSISLVADWLGVPDDERPDWLERVASAQEANNKLATAILGVPAYREKLARSLPSVDWSAVKQSLSDGYPVILASSHASFRFAMPLEFHRSGIDVRIISSKHAFATVPEYVDMHYASLDARPVNLMARRLIEVLKGGGCTFVTADGQSGAQTKSFPEFGVDARLPAGAFALALRYDAHVYWMDTSWQDGQLSTSLERLMLPDGITDKNALSDAWQRETLKRVRDAWARDVRNIHMNRAIVRVY
ncbi:hypothetical protein [Cohaesibacter marisflavi]|uniref:hypothetical protein n=1 Tax=Cohaesibacter marisflavi TaxID=655353 RepID=UPI0029C87310|nr:hypothetical protein [Cohaesibacter marisflavi]